MSLWSVSDVPFLEISYAYGSRYSHTDYVVQTQGVTFTRYTRRSGSFSRASPLSCWSSLRGERCDQFLMCHSRHMLSLCKCLQHTQMVTPLHAILHLFLFNSTFWRRFQSRTYRAGSFILTAVKNFIVWRYHKLFK